MNLLVLPLPIWTLVLAAGVLLVGIGLSRVRGSEERRCPNCWYDLSRTPGTSCPECDARGMHLDDLYPVRRRWMLVALGSVLMTPALWAFFQEGLEDPGVSSAIRTAAVFVALAGAVVFILGAIVLVRIARRAVLYKRVGRMAPHGVWSIAVLALVIMINGAVILRLPASRSGGWRGVLPDRLLTAIEWVGHKVTGK